MFKIFRTQKISKGPKHGSIIPNFTKYIITQKYGKTIHHAKMKLFDKYRG